MVTASLAIASIVRLLSSLISFITRSIAVVGLSRASLERGYQVRTGVIYNRVLTVVVINRGVLSH